MEGGCLVDNEALLRELAWRAAGVGVGVLLVVVVSSLSYFSAGWKDR